MNDITAASPRKENTYDYLDCRRKGQHTGSGNCPGAQTREEGPRQRTGGPRRALQGQGGQEGQPLQESAQEPQEGCNGPRWQQEGRDSGSSSAVQRSDPR